MQTDVRIPWWRLACGAFRIVEANGRQNQTLDSSKEWYKKYCIDHDSCLPPILSSFLRLSQNSRSHLSSLAPGYCQTTTAASGLQCNKMKVDDRRHNGTTGSFGCTVSSKSVHETRDHIISSIRQELWHVRRADFPILRARAVIKSNQTELLKRSGLCMLQDFCMQRLT